MRAHSVGLPVLASAALASMACRNEPALTRSPLGEVTGYRLVRLAGECSTVLQFHHVCGRGPWNPSCGDRFRSIRPGAPPREIPVSSATATTQIGCEDGWALWADDSRRITAFCVVENRVLGIGDLDESSDKKLKRLASVFFGSAATTALSRFSGRPTALPPTSKLHGGAATTAAMDAYPDAWLTHFGVWSGLPWQGWTDVFAWDHPIGEERDEMQMWSPIISIHRPKTPLDDDDYIEGVRCIEIALPKQ